MLNVTMTSQTLRDAGQCRRRAHLSVFHPELAVRDEPFGPSPGDREALVEAVRDRFKDAVVIDRKEGAILRHRFTFEALDGGKPVFQAFLIHQGVEVEVPILTPHGCVFLIRIAKVPDDIEKKDARTLWRAATIIWALNGLGLPFQKVQVFYINPDYEHRKGELQVAVDISGLAEGLLPEVAETAHKLHPILAERTPPPIHFRREACAGCEFLVACKSAAGIGPVSPFALPRMSGANKDPYVLAEQGIITLEGLDEHLRALHEQATTKKAREAARLTDKQARIAGVLRSGQPFIDRDYIREELAKWTKPFWGLDFETEQVVWPKWPRLKPFTNVPYLYSVMGMENGFEDTYIHKGRGDPREALARKLLKALGNQGSIVTWNMRFEDGVLAHLQEACPRYAEALAAIRLRLVDAWPLVVNSVIHPELPDYKLKTVAPALLGADYAREGDAVTSGAEANKIREELQELSWLKLGQRATLAEQLAAYCRRDVQDTLAIVRWLQRQVTA